jgi:hypothetical protein
MHSILKRTALTFRNFDVNTVKTSIKCYKSSTVSNVPKINHVIASSRTGTKSVAPKINYSTQISKYVQTNSNLTSIRHPEMLSLEDMSPMSSNCNNNDNTNLLSLILLSLAGIGVTVLLMKDDDDNVAYAEQKEMVKPKENLQGILFYIDVTVNDRNLIRGSQYS